MALANIAWVLARNGKRVLVIDWDLEAPGLHRYFAPFLTDPELVDHGSQGLIDFVIDFAVKAATPLEEGEGRSDDWYRTHADISRWSTKLRWPSRAGLTFEANQTGSIDFVPAGRQGPNYAQNVNSFDWDNFYRHFDGKAFFDRVKLNLARYDYVLIDSRTGVSDTAGICTVQMPDTVVICFTLNYQSIIGAEAVASSIAEQRTDVRILPVPMRVDGTSEKKLADAMKKFARSQFTRFLPIANSKDITQYWFEMEVKYQARYAYAEVLAPFEEQTSISSSVLPAMELLTRYITSNDVLKMGHLPEDHKRETLSAFEAAWKTNLEEALPEVRQEPPAPVVGSYKSTPVRYSGPTYVPGLSADVFISYVYRDNLDGWVTKLRDRLTEKLNPFLAGRAQLWFDDRIEPGIYFKEEIQGRLKDTPIFIAVVSPSYLESEFSIIHELEWFQNQRGREIIQLLKVPLEEGQDVPLREAQYIVLYDESDGRVLEGQRLDRKLDDVAAAITKRLREFWEMRPKIYVAQVRNERLKPRWDEMKEQLHSEGYAIVPKGILPIRVPDMRIREWVESSQISVHLDKVPDDLLAARQLTIARQTGRPLLILPEAPELHQIATVIHQVQDRIQSARKPAVYLIYDFYSDHQRVATLPELIRNQLGCEVLLPEAGERYHRFCLEVSSGVLLFRGEASEDWLKSQELSLLQSAARRRDRADAKYFIKRANGDPGGVRVIQGTQQELIIERTGEPDPLNDLKPFFDILRSRMQSLGAQ
jgi:hypothetical protein